MATFKVEHDDIETRGDAQEYLREIIRELGKGYTTGYGWELAGPEGEEKVHDSATCESEDCEKCATEIDTTPEESPETPPSGNPAGPADQPPGDEGSEPWNNPAPAA